jgi:CheY-like chemotaxis protein
VKKRILVVDDEKDNAAVFRIALEDTGLYELSAKMNGYELYEKIKYIDDKIKVCFLTAFGEGYHEEFKIRYQGRRADNSSATHVHFLRKPITIDDLVEKVNEII